MWCRGVPRRPLRSRRIFAGAKRVDLSTATLTSANYHCVMLLSGLRVGAAIIRYAPTFPNTSQRKTVRRNFITALFALNVVIFTSYAFADCVATNESGGSCSCSSINCETGTQCYCQNGTGAATPSCLCRGRNQVFTPIPPKFRDARRS